MTRLITVETGCLVSTAVDEATFLTMHLPVEAERFKWQFVLERDLVFIMLSLVQTKHYWKLISSKYKQYNQ